MCSSIFPFSVFLFQEQEEQMKNAECSILILSPELLFCVFCSEDMNRLKVLPVDEAHCDVIW